VLNLELLFTMLIMAIQWLKDLVLLKGVYMLSNALTHFGMLIPITN